MHWRKSTYSFANGNCVEAGLQGARWRTSTRSAGNGACIEAGQGPGIVAVRDTKLGRSPVLTFSADTWAAFTSAVKAGEANRIATVPVPESHPQEDTPPIPVGAGGFLHPPAISQLSRTM